MDGYTANKIAGAVLWSALVIVGSKVLIEELSHPVHPEQPGYEIIIPGAEPAALTGAKEDGKPAAASTQASLGKMLRAADAARGAKVAKKCAGCHTFNQGGKQRSGPNLYGTVTRKIAAVDGFKYSPALKKKNGKWTFAELKCFLENPRKCVPGTKMSFRGIRKPAQLADLIVYMNNQSASPAALPN